MKFSRYKDVAIGQQIDFDYAMDIEEIVINLITTSTVGNRQLAITVFNSSDEQQSQVTAYATVAEDSTALFLFYQSVTEDDSGGVIITDLSGSHISVPAGGYITVTDTNSTDASDTITVDLIAA